MTTEETKNEDTRTKEEIEIDDLYEKIGKLFGHLRNDNAERYNALDLILKCLEKINKIQKRTNPIEYEEMTFESIYTLASSSVGATTEEVDELLQANQEIAEERDALCDTIERLNFHIKFLKNKAADEIFSQNTIDMIDMEKIEKMMEEMNVIIENFNETIAKTEKDDTKENKEPFSNSMLKIVCGEEHPLSLLKNTKENTKNDFKNYLRKNMFAFDHADMTTLKHLIAAQQKIMEKYEKMMRNREGISSVADIVMNLKKIEERQTTEYEEAAIQINRLQALVDEYEEKHGMIENMEETIKELEEKKKSLEETISFLEDRVKDLKEKTEGHKNEETTKDEDMEKRLRQKIEELENEIKRLKDPEILKKLESQNKELKKMIARYEHEITILTKKYDLMITKIPMMLEDTGRKLTELIIIGNREEVLKDVMEFKKEYEDEMI